MTAQPARTTSAPVASPAGEAPAKPKVSVEEYLAMERTAGVRHEYVDGEILAMAGESPAHNRVAGNIYRLLGNIFEERECEVFIENVRLRVTPTQYRYPDVVALCGEAQFDDTKPPSLLNPSVIFEVLSPSTEGFDRDEKFMEYRQIAGLTDYLLVAQDAALVIHYARQSPNQWTLTEYTALTDALSLPALEVALPLSDIYRKIRFEMPASTVEAPTA